MRDVMVVGVGMTRFGRFPDKSATDHGIEATNAALDDAGLTWPEVQMAYCGAAGIGIAPGNAIGHGLGLTGTPIVNIENASASGSSAFREAYLAVAEGRSDVALAVGVGKMDRNMFTQQGVGGNSARALPVLPAAASFAMLARRRMHLYGSTPEVFARVAVKNHRHGALNPYAQFQEEVTLEEAMSARMIAEPLRLMDCCPTGDGGAAAILASRRVAARLRHRPMVKISASAFTSELFTNDPFPEWPLTEATSKKAYEEASLGPADVDFVQVHDAFSIEELEYYEALGFCARGDGDRLVHDGSTELGGRLPFSTDGGLLARGHPLGPTGLAQMWETTLQLRGDAGERQVEHARVGLVQMIGAGSVCIIHILQRE